MIAKMRLLAGALIVSLVIVPVVVRATRVFDPSGRATIAPSFVKSFDVPPHVADAPPDPAAPILVRVEYPLVASPAPAAHPQSLQTVASLRGPPSQLLS